MGRHLFGIVFAVFVVFGAVISQAAAICALPDPDVSLELRDAPPACLTVEAYGEFGSAYLSVDNECDEQVRVERVNCTECGDQILEVIAGERAHIEVPVGHSEPIRSDYRWSISDASGALSVTTEMPESPPCKDYSATPVDEREGCSTASRGQGAVPFSFALLALLATGVAVYRREVAW